MKKIGNLFLVAMLAVLITLPSCTKEKIYNSADEWVAEVQSTLKNVTAEQLKLKLEDWENPVFLLDVREPMEYYPGFIPGATNLPGGLLIFKMSDADFWTSHDYYDPPTKDSEIIVYCKKGKRSVMAADNLIKLGYKNVKFLDGGWKQWELTYPLEYDKALEKMGGHEAEGEVGGC
jgi:rhodanese-related sulfurtransferase